jgi:hypothetical protein
MNLYKLIYTHQPSNHSIGGGILKYLIAKSDEDVYEWIKSQPSIMYDELTEVTLYNDWYLEESNDPSFKSDILECRGEIDSDISKFLKIHDGVTLYGWVLVTENIKYEYSELVELGEIIKIC